MNKQTVSNKREERYEREVAKITRIANQANRLKQCPICGGPQGHGVTCGQIECIRAWLFPSRRYVEHQSEVDDE